jgi:prepilin-type processing-associated H-X9-DG protein
MFTEGKRDWLNWWCGSAAFEDSETDWCWWSNIGWYDEGLITRAVLSPTLAQSAPYDARLIPIFRKHTGVSNFALADGHVKAFRAEAILDGSHWLANWPN